MKQYESPIFETSRDEIVSPSRRLTALPPAFFLVSAYGIGYGLLLVPTGLFVGLHILAGAAIHILAGATSLVVAFGLQRRNAWAWWLGAFLSFAIMILEIAGFVASLGKLEWSGVVFFGMMTILFSGVFLMLLMVRKECRLPRR